jgi:hypothetical protein
MAKDADADVNRGVFTAGSLYQKGDFSLGAIDYYSADIINIGYGRRPYAKDERDMNRQWAPAKGVLKGLSLRLRYAIVEQHGGNSGYLNDVRVIGNYTISF